MTLKEKMFEYLRENSKASYKELEENAGIPYGIAKLICTGQSRKEN